MKRGSIGLDNPSFRGNVRTYRRRQSSYHSRPLQPWSATQVVPKVEPVAPAHIPKPKIEQSRTVQPSTYSVGAEIAAPAPIKYKKKQAKAFLVEPVELNTNFWVPESNDQAQVLDKIDTIPAHELLASPVKSKTFAVKKLEKSPKKKIFSLKFALPAMALVIFVSGLGIALQSVQTNRRVEAQVQVQGATDSTKNSEQDVPDETEPDKKTFGSYKVTPDTPRFITINKIGVHSRVVRVGVKANNELKAPSNIYDVGWYENSAKPGGSGATLLDAHVHGPTKPGAFNKLKNLAKNDLVEVERGDGQKIKYRVVSTEVKNTSEVDMQKAMLTQEPGKSGLNMITCAGKYNSQTRDYEQRLVVYAVQI